MSWKKAFKNPLVKAGLLGGGLAGLTVVSGGTLPVAAGVGLAGAGLYQQYKNYSEQQKNLEYQMETQREAFQREDNSISRRVADLTASGLSPVLAAGQGAGTGPIVSTKPPQMDNPLTPVADVLGLLKMKEDITNTVAQRDLIKAQTDLANTSDAIKNWDLNKYVEWNLPSNASGLAKTIRDLGSLFKGFGPIAGPAAQDLSKKLAPEGDKNPYKRKFEVQEDPIKKWMQDQGWLPKNK